MKAQLVVDVTLVFYYLLITLQCSPAEAAVLTSKCGVNGSQVEFYCPGALYWEINREEVLEYEDLENVTVTSSYHQSDTGLPEDVTEIFCETSRDSHEMFLIVTDPSNPRPQLGPRLRQANKTALQLEWQHPAHDEYMSVTFSYTVVLTIGSNYQKTFNVENINVGSLPSLMLDFSGHECEEFRVDIYMPGTCDSKNISGNFLLNPLYPEVMNVSAIILGNSTLSLTWKHPENVFDEPQFNYSVTATVRSTGAVVANYNISISSDDKPQEVFNLSEALTCKDINFTVALVNDCRLSHTIAPIPTFPQDFISEIITEVKYDSIGNLQEVEYEFTPPALCEFQTASYVLSYTDGTDTWSASPQPFPLGEVAVIEDEIKTEGSGIVLESEYTLTATFITEYGNISSYTVFNTKKEAKLNQTTLGYEIHNEMITWITWQNPTNIYQKTFTYIVNAMVVTSKELLKSQTLAFSRNTAPYAEYNLEEHLCEEVNFTISIFPHNQSISIVVVQPKYPSEFEHNITAETFMLDGEIKELEITFTPPQLCSFQSAYYMLSFTSDDNETWSREPVAITDTSKPVKEDIETGFVLNVNYIVTVTVFMEHRNITSAANFRFTSQDITQNAKGTTDLSTLEMGGIAGGAVAALLLVLVCGCAGGVMVVYLLRQRKIRKMKVLSSRSTARPTVTNPIYETGEDVYEELPDQEDNKASKLTSDQLYSDVAPALPPARYDYLPTADRLPGEEGTSATPLTQTPKQDRKLATLDIPKSESAGVLSTGSGEDCYTAMSPAGTVTLMPRNRHSGSHSMTSGEAAGSVEGRFTLNCV